MFVIETKQSSAAWKGKRLGSPYRSGRSPHWIKVKNHRENPVAIEMDIGELCPVAVWRSCHLADSSTLPDLGLMR
jgi:hypothetical protein